MKRSLAAVVLVIVAGLSSGFWLFESGSPASSQSGLEAVQIAPHTNSGEPASARLYEAVEFVYRLRNTGTATLRDLKPRLGCSCQLTQSPAAVLAPGETTRLGFVLKASHVGTTEAPIGILADGSAQPLLVLRPALHVPVDPPVLSTDRPMSPLLTFIEGTDTTQTLQFDTIEKKESEPWIVGVRLSMEDDLQLAQRAADERNHPDPALCFRTYRFDLSAKGLPGGTRRGLLALEARPAGKPAPDPIPIELRVLDRIVLLPNPLRIELEPGVETLISRVTAVDRTGQGPIQAVKFDRDLLDVRSIDPGESRQFAFDIELKSRPLQVVHTRVTFAVDGGSGRDLVLDIEPRSAE